MAERIELVDHSEEGEALRQQVRQRRRRVVIPVLGVAALIIALLAIALYSYRSNRVGALALSEDVLASLDRRIHTEVQSYLQPAATAAAILAGVLEDPGLVSMEDRRQIADPLAQETLANLPQLSIVSFGTTKGEFMMLRRMPDGAMDTKVIQRPQRGTRTLWIHRNPEGEITGVEEVPNDGYDHRSRPWYQGALKRSGTYWTDVYVFFTDRKPGVTVSRSFHAPDGTLLGVLGLDITLDQLGVFLSGLEIGDSGRAMIIDDAGHLVAYPDLAKMLKVEGETLATASLEELGDPVLTRAWNRFRVEGHGRRSIDLDGRRYISTVSSLRDLVGRDWSVLIVVPEDDFVGFVEDNSQRVLLMSLAVVLLTALMAALLVRQGLRADHKARQVLARQNAIERQGAAFADIAAIAADLGKGDNRERARAQVTQRIAEGAGVRRVSLWRVEEGGRLHCADAYDRESQGHTRDTELLAGDLPQLFAALERGEPLMKPDAAADPETAELHHRYLQPLGCRSLISVPVRATGSVFAHLWLEHDAFNQSRAEELLAFARSVANVIGLTVSALSQGEDQQRVAVSRGRSAAAVAVTALTSPHKVGRGTQAPAGGAGQTPVGSRPVVDQVAERARSGGLAAEIFSDTTVMVLEFPDALALAERTAEAGGVAVAELLVRFLDSRARELGIEYVRIVGHQVVAAAGFGSDPDEGARRIATLARDIQERCTRIFGQVHERPRFRLGLDCGRVLGSPMGQDHKRYNLWGPAVQTATAMAAAELQGEIQATDAIYQRLREHYLFKPRGAYYLEGSGCTATYLLAGAL